MRLIPSIPDEAFVFLARNPQEEPAQPQKKRTS
jgi:hypothetical protein